MRVSKLAMACVLLSAGLVVRAGDFTPGVITTIAGNGTQGSGGDGGPATGAQLDSIVDIAVDPLGNLYIAESNAIRRVSPDGVINTVPGAPGGDIAVDAAGNIYVGHEDGIRKITPAGSVSILAHDVVHNDYGWEGLGSLVNDSAGNVYFSFVRFFVGTSVYKVNADETVTDIGDMGGETYVVAADPAGNLYFYDGYAVSKVDSQGNPTFSFSVTGHAFAVDSRGNLFTSETGETPRIWRVMPDGTTSIVAGDGTKGFSGDGGPATSAQLGSPVSIAMDNGDNLLIADSENFRIRKVTWAMTETFFAHVVVGDGYSTTITLTNTGDTPISGDLILTDPMGQRLTASEADLGEGSSFPVFVMPAGTTSFSIHPVRPGELLKGGWARVVAGGGVLNGVATFHRRSGGAAQVAGGVLPSQPMRYATIPVDDDSSQGRFTAYAVANPTDRNLVIRLALVDQDGKVVDEGVSFTLEPNQQTARYLFRDVARSKFKGSVVLRAQEGCSFIAMALRQYETLFSVIPVIPGKASCVPD